MKMTKPASRQPKSVAVRMAQRSALGAITVAFLVTWAAAGCSMDGGDAAETSPAPSTSTTTQEAPTSSACARVTTPQFPQVDRCDVESVMTAAAARIFTFRPSTEDDPSAAFWAAAPLLTPTYQKQVGVSAGMLATVSAGEWAQWASDDTRVTASANVTSDEHPTGTTRVVAVRQRFTDPSGRTVAPERTTVLYMVAEKDPETGAYAVSQIVTR